MTNKLVVIINILRVPKIKKILLYEMKFLLSNYSCLQNPWLGGYRPQIPVLSLLCPQPNLLNPPPEQNSWVCHCTVLLTYVYKWRESSRIWTVRRSDCNVRYILNTSNQLRMDIHSFQWHQVETCWYLEFILDGFVTNPRTSYGQLRAIPGGSASVIARR